MMARKPKEIQAVFTRERDGTWTVVATRSKHESAITEGKTLAMARRRIRQAVALLLDVDESEVGLQERFELPASAQKALAAAKGSSEALALASDRARKATRKAALALHAQGLSYRDAADLLGLTGARVHQLVKE